MSHEKALSPTNEKHEVESDGTSEIDLLAFHEEHAGRLIIDPECVVYLLIAKFFAGSQWNQ
jgi:preprotein translocase subunit Sec61beta